MSVLTVAYMLALIDRQILGLLVAPIKISLMLTDTQLGFLMGPAFAIFYVILGWPIGWMADRMNRRNIVATSIALWSLMTALCGLTRSFWQLFVARIGVGVGEAALTPTVLSLVSDLFSPRQRASAIVIYMAGIPLGIGLAYLCGGWLSRVTLVSGLSIPLLHDLRSWQMAFIAVGLSGLPISLMVLRIREPARQRASQGTRVSSRATLAQMATQWRAYAALAIGMCPVTTIAYGAGWNATLFQRVWGWPVSRSGLWIGLTYLVCGPLGALISSLANDKLAARGYADAAYRAGALGILVLVVSATLYPLAPSPQFALMLNVFSVAGNAFASGMGAAAIVALAPTAYRAQTAAIYLMLINLVGLMLGPPLIGWLSDHFYRDVSGVGPAMATVAASAGIPALTILWMGRRSYRAALPLEKLPNQRFAGNGAVSA